MKQDNPCRMTLPSFAYSVIRLLRSWWFVALHAHSLNTWLILLCMLLRVIRSISTALVAGDAKTTAMAKLSWRSGRELPRLLESRLLDKRRAVGGWIDQGHRVKEEKPSLLGIPTSHDNPPQ